jgi:hypothetical protein
MTQVLYLITCASSSALRVYQCIEVVQLLDKHLPLCYISIAGYFVQLLIVMSLLVAFLITCFFSRYCSIIYLTLVYGI